jgi:hypothetical protein
MTKLQRYAHHWREDAPNAAFINPHTNDLWCRADDVSSLELEFLVLQSHERRQAERLASLEAERDALAKRVAELEAPARLDPVVMACAHVFKQTLFRADNSSCFEYREQCQKCGIWSYQMHAYVGMLPQDIEMLNEGKSAPIPSPAEPTEAQVLAGGKYLADWLDPDVWDDLRECERQDYLAMARACWAAMRGAR